MAVAALIYLFVALALFRELLPVMTTSLFGDPGDPVLNAAILAWNAKHVPLSATWWNFPAFAPLSGVTAFTEHLLGAYPLTSPVIWITGNPVLAYNLLLLACFPLNGMATYALARELTGSRTGAFVAGLAFAFAPYVAEHVTHIQMLLAFGMPFALLGLHLFMQYGKPRHLVWFAVGWLDALLSNAYLLVFFPILVALWTAWFFRPADARRWMAVAMAIVLATLPVVPLLVGYQARQHEYGLVRGLDEIRAFSATWSSIAGISHRAVLWRGWLPNTFAEASLFPGFAIAALGLLGGATGRRRSALVYLCAAIAMWLLALGPDRGPYWLLLKLPGAQSIRVPARAWLVGALCLAVLAGFGAAWLAGGARRRSRGWVVVPLALLLVAEAWFSGPLIVAPPAVQLYLPADAVVLDLPITLDYRNADAEYRAVLGNYRVVNGYSGYFPPDFFSLVSDVSEQRSSVFTPFRRRADLYVIVRDAADASLAAWIESQQGVERAAATSDWKVYRLPRLANP